MNQSDLIKYDSSIINNKIYVVLLGGTLQSVTEIDTLSDSISKNIDVGGLPETVVYNSENNCLYVGVKKPDGTHNILIVDIKNNYKRIYEYVLDGEPYVSMFNPIDKRVYILCYFDYTKKNLIMMDSQKPPTISVIPLTIHGDIPQFSKMIFNPFNQKLYLINNSLYNITFSPPEVKHIPLGFDIFPNPNMFINSNDNKVYVCGMSGSDKFLGIIDDSHLSNRIKILQDPNRYHSGWIVSMVFNSTENKTYVSHWYAIPGPDGRIETVTRINNSDHSMKQIPVNSPTTQIKLLYNPNNNYLYSNFFDKIDIIDCTSDIKLDDEKSIKNIYNLYNPILANNKIYAYDADATIFVIDCNTNTIIKKITFPG